MLDLSKPLVSVVITTYNYAVYLPTAVESVLNQTNKNLEIIIVNDGSTDNTDKVIIPYLKDKRIKYIKQKNAGQAVAKNCGIRNSGGDYIAFLDADDYWMPEKLEKQMPLFTKDGELGIVYSKAKWIDSKNNVIKINYNNIFKPRAGKVSDFLIVDNFIPFSSSMVKKECFKKVGLFDEKLEMAIDWDLWLRMSIYYKVSFVDEELITYRVGHPGQMSKNQEKRLKQAESIRSNFIKNNPNAITKKDLKKALAYRYKRIGDYYQNIDKEKSIHYNLKSLVLNPFQPIVYLRLIKTLIYHFTKKPYITK